MILKGHYTHSVCLDFDAWCHGRLTKIFDFAVQWVWDQRTWAWAGPARKMETGTNRSCIINLLGPQQPLNHFKLVLGIICITKCWKILFTKNIMSTVGRRWGKNNERMSFYRIMWCCNECVEEIKSWCMVIKWKIATDRCIQICFAICCYILQCHKFCVVYW